MVQLVQLVQLVCVRGHGKLLGVGVGVGVGLAQRFEVDNAWDLRINGALR
eukprot:COSAG01_NODE_10066_length_2258_cov_1.938861_1_plen_49_part_10